MQYQFNYCPNCATPLQMIMLEEDGGPTARLRCPACAYTHWNNPTPVLAAIVQLEDVPGAPLLLARNAAWPGRRFALITGFMEAGETPEEGITREVAEETSLTVSKLTLVGAYDFQRMNQVIIAYHALASGTVTLSPELVEYKLVAPQDVKCWKAGTGHALADWLRTQGIEPEYMDWPPADAPAPSVD